MKRTFLLVGLLLLPFAGSEGVAQPVKVLPNARHVSFQWKYTIHAEPETNRVTFTVLVPKTLERRQKILVLKYSQRPAEVFEKGLNRYARFIFEKPAAITEVTVAVDAELYRYDWATATRLPAPEQQDDVRLWLRAEKFIEKNDSEIRNVARTLLGGSTEETLRKTMDFVTTNMSKVDYDGADHGAAKSLKNKRGDCTDFADLFVALCRANNIPARWVEGFLAYSKVAKGDTAKHDWAEVYLPEYGWVPFDPFHTHLKSATFTHKRPDYLYLDFERRNATLGNFHYWYYQYNGGRVRVSDEFAVTQNRVFVPAR